MEDLEKNRQELEDVSYAIDCLESALDNLKNHKEDFNDDIKSLADVLASCNYVASQIEEEMQEQEEMLMAEHIQEVECANAEFEKERI